MKRSRLGDEAPLLLCAQKQENVILRKPDRMSVILGSFTLDENRRRQNICADGRDIQSSFMNVLQYMSGDLGKK